MGNPGEKMVEHAYNTSYMLGKLAGSLYAMHVTNEIQQTRFTTINNERVTDDLTGLLNYRGLVEAYEENFAKGAQRRINDTSTSTHIIMFTDLDKFSEINTSIGHHNANSILKSTAECLRESLRTTDIIGRFGGDEFIVLLPNTTKENSIIVAEKIRHRIAQALQFGDTSITPTISIGLAQLDLGLDFDMIYTKANEAMYESKKHGRNSITFFD
ncbi:MAG: hypothetical protein NVSMB46_02950 [Candidatus Saccharimonadales bacterium]